MIDIATCFTYAYSNGTYTDFFQTVGNSSEASTNPIDWDVNGIKIAGSKPPWLIVKIGATPFDVLTSIEIAIESDSVEDFNTNSTKKTIWHKNVPLAACDAAGDLLVNDPLGHYDYQRYLRLYFNILGSGDQATIAAWLADGPEPAVTDFDLIEAT